MKKCFIMLSLLLACLEMSAVPALRLRKLLTLEDGTKVMATFRGDEHYGYFVTDDGLVVREMTTGVYRMVPEQEHAQAISAARANVQVSNARRVAGVEKREAGITGSRTGIVILAQFQDKKLAAHSTKEYFNRMFNEKGFNDDGNAGSVHDYFSDQSYGQFDLTFDVVGPVTLPNTLAYYGEHSGSDNDARPREMAYDACYAARNLADFTKYDWDNDGVVDQVFIIFAGYSEAQGGPAESIWPHEWAIYDKELIIDGKRIFTYGCSSELRGYTGENIDGIGTACHEFSHCLGLPDCYDTSYQAFGMGDWDVMSGGSYLGVPMSTSPIAYTAYERWVSGWLNPVELKDETTITDMRPLEETGEAYVLYNDGNRNEYYLLENRQLPKWGKSLGAHGLMVMRIDYDQSVWAQNKVNNDAARQRMTYVPADNTMSNITYAGDPFPGSSNNANLTNSTTPAARLYNKNTDGTYFLNKPIESITESADGKISFIACAPPVPVPSSFDAAVVTDDKVSCQWDEVEGAVGYELELTSTPGNVDPSESVVINETFKNVPRKAGFADIGSNLDKYCDNKGWNGEKIFTSKKGLKIGSSNENGTLSTPAFSVDRTNNATFMIRIESYKDGTSVDCVLYSVRQTSSGYEAIEGWKFKAEEKGYYVINSTKPLTEPTYLWLYQPSGQVCIDSLVIFDGKYSPEDLGFKTQSNVRHLQHSDAVLDIENCDITEVTPVVPQSQSRSAAVPPMMKAQSTKIFKTETNSYEFTDLPEGYTYKIRVRACLSNGRVSDWSKAIEVDNSTGITCLGEQIQTSDNKSVDSNIYDFMGRKMKDTSRPGIYIQNGKKVIKL